MRTLCGGLLFTSDFECGNLAKVELTTNWKELSGRGSLKTADFNAGHSDKSELPVVIQKRDEEKSENPSIGNILTGETNIIPTKDLANIKVTGKLVDKSTGTKVKSVPKPKLKDPTPALESEKGDLEFCLWTKPDCYMTPYQNGNRSWFYFGVQGGPPGARVKFNIMNLNFQQKLYSQGMAPVYRVTPGKEKWSRILKAPKHKIIDDGNLMMSFHHRLPLNTAHITYFAFTYPFTYTECQKMLDNLDVLYSTSVEGVHDSEAIYYYREHLCNSLDGNRVDLLTISSYHKISDERESRLSDLFPDLTKKRCHKFHDKKVVFISARVHPGETPSSFVFKGFLHFLLSTDERAIALRKQFIFKLIPMLNPDGVIRGHYRTDSRGVNLNRVYTDPSLTSHPTIYAVKQLILYYHSIYRESLSQHSIPSETADMSPTSNYPNTDAKGELLDLEGQDANTLPKNPVGLWMPSVHEKEKHAKFKGSEPLLDKFMYNDSGIFCYVDFHGHASKPGCFMYGNYFDDTSQKIECILLPKLLSLNCPYFDFNSCNFSKQNMMRKGPDDATNKEGCGRVSVYRMTGIIHSYTLECNYNGSRIMPSIPLHKDMDVNNPLTEGKFNNCKFTPEIFEEVGRGLAVSILDLVGSNPQSVIPQTSYSDLDGVRSWLLCHLQFQKALKACNKLFPKKHENSKTSVNVPQLAKEVSGVGTSLGKNLDLSISMPASSRSFKKPTAYDGRLQTESPLLKASVRRFPRRTNYCWLDASAGEKIKTPEEITDSSKKLLLRKSVHRASLRTKKKGRKSSDLQSESPQSMAIRNKRLQSSGNMRPRPVLKTIDSSSEQSVPISTNNPVPVITVRARETVCDKCESPINMFCSCTSLSLPFLKSKDQNPVSVSLIEKKPDVPVNVPMESPPTSISMGKPNIKTDSPKKRNVAKSKGVLLTSNSSSSSTTSLHAK